jgi:hypothetical protein
MKILIAIIEKVQPKKEERKYAYERNEGFGTFYFNSKDYPLLSEAIPELPIKHYSEGTVEITCNCLKALCLLSDFVTNYNFKQVDKRWIR